MKKVLSTHFTLVLFLSIFSFKVSAQDDLMNMLQKQQPKKAVPVFATFKSTRLITGQSIEHIAKKHLNFVILHRFGEANLGAYELFGLDQANIRFAFDYGLTDRIQLGVARSSIGKTIDGNLKIKLVKQKRGGGSPISIGYYGNIAANTLHWENPDRENYWTSKLSFFHQLIFAKKINDALSVQIAPCVVHNNLVAYTSYPNNLYALGTGASIKLTRSTRLNIEYYPRLNGDDMLSSAGGKLYDYLGIGFDIETGGHVFQMMFCNGSGMLEQHIVGDTRTSWQSAGVRLGFNISRTFSFDNSAKKASW